MTNPFTVQNFSPEQLSTLTAILVAGGRISNADNPAEETIEILGGKEFVAESIDEAFDKAKEEASNLASAVGDGFLYIVRNIGVVILEAIELTIKGIVEAFEGREIATITTLTVIVIVIVAIFTLRHELLTGPAGAGEYMAMNRPSPGDGFLGP